MKGMETGILNRPGVRLSAVCLFLAAVLPVLCGCAVKATVGTDPVDQGTTLTQASTVVRFGEGRQGFAIREVSQLDEAARRDFLQAVDLIKNENYDRAVDLLEKVVAQSPGVTAPYINLAIAYRRLGKPEQAEPPLKSALDLVPGHPAASNEYGLLYRQTGRFAEARAIYEKALDRFPEYYPVHRNLGILCDLYLNDLACALEHYEIYARVRPGDKQVQLWIADLRNRLESR